MTEKKKYAYKCEHCGKIVDHIEGTASHGSASYSITPDGKGDHDYEYYDHDFDEHDSYCPECNRSMYPDDAMVQLDSDGNVIPETEDD